MFRIIAAPKAYSSLQTAIAAAGRKARAVLQPHTELTGTPVFRFLIVLKSGGRRISPAVWIVITLLVVIPIGASVYSEFFTRTSIYRLRVTVVDQQGIAVENEEEAEGVKVWSSLGGEPQRVKAGWQFEIPSAGKPKDGKLSIYASKKSAFLTGRTDLILADDFNPAITVNLKRDDSGRVRGQVIDAGKRGVAGVRVFVVGYESEAIITKEGGNFELPAHAAAGQTTLLAAEKNGYRPERQYYPAGDKPVELRLERNEIW
ncbi:MAG: carboxypeptidase regulatory-like domain-containing protein [Blastocatellia bacterium]|nr:carboxypeptidase regulatory-like domain-containing protein [Blastocatellia bacterium]